MPEFPTENGFIYYEVAGPPTVAAPTLTLLHNFMSSGRTAWGQLIPALAEARRVITPDLPGHGRSQGRPPGFHHGAIPRQLALLFAAEGAATGHVAGCSAGGMIAQLLVHQGLIQPRSLILVSTTYSINPATTGNYNSLAPENFKAGDNWMEATAKLHDPYNYPGYYFEVILPAFRKLTPASSIDLSLTALQEWSFPVCLIHGAEDEFFPSFIVEQMAQALPQAELHLIPGQRHSLLFRQPRQVREIMQDFLARVERTAE